MFQGEVESESLRDQRAEPPLVSRIIQEESFLRRFREPNCRLRAAYRTAIVSALLAALLARGGDTDPTTHKRPDHGEKACGVALNIAAIVAVGGDVREAIQHFDARHFNMIEPDPAVIDTVQPIFSPLSSIVYSRQRMAVLSSDRNEKGVHPMFLTLHLELSEHDSQLPSSAAFPI